MTIKAILYCVIVPIVIWAINSINFNHVFKKNQYYASRVFFLLLTISLSYLTVNFFYDFFLNVKFV